ncbi:MAG: aerotaxis receptor, partial [Gallionellaceae bacterium]
MYRELNKSSNQIVSKYESFKVKNWSLKAKLQAAIQVPLLVILTAAQMYITNGTEQEAMHQAQEKGEQVANQFIDNENMLMVTGQISDEANRKLLITKATASGHVKSVSILRSPQLIEQYGAGMSGQQATDDVQRKVMETRQSSVMFMNNAAGDPVLRIVTPYLLSKDFHGTDCTGCHAGGEGAV